MVNNDIKSISNRPRKKITDIISVFLMGLAFMVFVVVAVTSLVVYNMLPSVKDEGGFQ